MLRCVLGARFLVYFHRWTPRTPAVAASNLGFQSTPLLSFRRSSMPVQGEQLACSFTANRADICTLSIGQLQHCNRAQGAGKFRAALNLERFLTSMLRSLPLLPSHMYYSPSSSVVSQCIMYRVTLRSSLGTENSHPQKQEGICPTLRNDGYL